MKLVIVVDVRKNDSVSKRVRLVCASGSTYIRGGEPVG